MVNMSRMDSISLSGNVNYIRTKLPSNPLGTITLISPGIPGAPVSPVQ